jgi:Ca-activated chloride channel homolog
MPRFAGMVDPAAEITVRPDEAHQVAVALSASAAHTRVMSFGAPLALSALVVVPVVLAILLLADRRAARHAVVFTNLDLLAGLVPRRRRRRWVPVALVLLALATAAAATARPRAVLQTPVDHATVILLVDVSGSMSARDVEPTRLDAAAAAMRRFVDELPGRFRVGLVQFSDVPQVIAPPTDDHDEVRRAIGYLTPDSGTAIGSGIVTATRLAQTSLARAGVVREPGKPLPAAIVLLSDGKQNQGGVRPLDAAARAKAAGLVVDTVALGTPRGTLGIGAFALRVPPDPPLMRAIARATGGETSTAADSTQLASFYSSLGRSIGREPRPREITSWFALAAGLLLVGAVALGRLWSGPFA